MAILALLFCLLLVSCGGGSAPMTPSTPGGPSNPNTFTITASGITPKELTVAPGTRVLFVNTDSRRHDMASDPHPEHTDCSEINSVGLLSPGQSRETGNLVAVRTCGFHDHDNPENAGLKGRVITR
jgi:plastocyanin